MLLIFSSWLQPGQAAQTSDTPTRESRDLSSAVNVVVIGVAKLRIKIIRKLHMGQCTALQNPQFLTFFTHSFHREGGKTRLYGKKFI